MREPTDVRLLLVCGSTRPGSSNLAVLQAVAEQRLDGLETELYEGLTELPAFVPEQRPLPPPVTDLLARMTAADAVLISTPEYAGGLPGSLKNLLDWTVGGGELYGKPVAWLDVAHPGRGAGARAQLATVLGYVGARVVEEACVHLPMQRDGDVVTLDPAAAPLLRNALELLVAVVRGSRAAPDA